MCRRLARVPSYRLVAASLAVIGFFTAFSGTAVLAQSECAEAQSITGVASVHPTAANYIDLGNWFGNQNQCGCAILAFRAALKLSPKSPAALHGLSIALLADDDSASAVALLAGAQLNETLTVDLGRALVKQGRFDDAAETLNAGLRKYPSSEALTTELGGLYILENDADHAVKAAESTALARPKDLEAQRFYLRTLVTKNDVEKATPLAHRLLETAPNDADLLYLVGTIERMTADYPASRRDLERSVAIFPGSGDCHYNLGLTLAHLGDHKGAKSELDKALELGERDPSVHFQIAMELRNLGETEEAKKEIELYEAGKDAEAKRSLAGLKSAAAAQALGTGDPQGAVALYREACAAQPQDVMLAFKLATALDAAGDLGGERTALEQAVEINPRFGLAQEQLGYVESQMGNTTAAEARFRQVLQLAPEYPDGWVSLASTLAMEARFPEAREAVATALKLDPKNSNAIELSRKLASRASGSQP